MEITSELERRGVIAGLASSNRITRWAYSQTEGVGGNLVAGGRNGAACPDVAGPHHSVNANGGVVAPEKLDTYYEVTNNLKNRAIQASATPEAYGSGFGRVADQPDAIGSGSQLSGSRHGSFGQFGVPALDCGGQFSDQGGAAAFLKCPLVGAQYRARKASSHAPTWLMALERGGKADQVLRPHLNDATARAIHVGNQKKCNCHNSR